MRSGQGCYTDFPLHEPKVGDYLLLLSSPFGTASVHVEVTEGRPQYLTIKEQPAPSTDNRNPLWPQPRLELADGAQNVVLGADAQLKWQLVSAATGLRPPSCPPPRHGRMHHGPPHHSPADLRSTALRTSAPQPRGPPQHIGTPPRTPRPHAPQSPQGTAPTHHSPATQSFA